MSDKDVFEDRPFESGVTEIDWTGVAWRDIPPERVDYLVNRAKRDKGKIVQLLNQVPVGQGRKQEGFPDRLTAQRVRNSLYRAAQKAWGTKGSDGKVHPNIKVEVTLDKATGTYQIEFVHLAPKDENDERTKIRRQVHKEEDLKDELYNLCLRHATPTVSGQAVYNALKRGGINTIEDLKKASLDDLAEIRNVGPEKREVIAEMKKGIK